MHELGAIADADEYRYTHMHMKTAEADSNYNQTGILEEIKCNRAKQMKEEKGRKTDYQN